MIVAEIGSGGWPRALEAVRRAGFEGETILVGSAALQPAAEGLRARFVPAEPGASAQRQRAQGLAASRAELAASVSEDYIVDAAWLAAARSAEADVTCGPVTPPAGAGWAARAAWMWEYAHLPAAEAAGPIAAREAAWIPAGNVVYRRAALPLDELAAAASEIEAHGALAARGLRFVRDPRLRAGYRPPSPAAFLRDRKRWSAEWARRAGRSRPIAVAAALALPLVLPARQARWWLPRPGWRLRFAAALPAFLAFSVAQALGELSVALGPRRP
ncbi:MAG: hypothetical protein GC160_17830 [Acidobacteria bacterium]|nr:hypothetical protein [Acidobacteriota bacterium]